MCTLSVIAAGGGMRLAFNRDELRTRQPARPPRVVRAGLRLAVMPVDAESGGTWIAANDAGLVFALLNANLATAPARAGRISRGAIIPQLLLCSNVATVVRELSRTALDQHSPFRLVIVGSHSLMSFKWDGYTTQLTSRDFNDLPLMFTSSGLGDQVVQSPRRQLFERMNVNTPRRQDRFHQHRWRDRPHLSVHMSRPDACTVSRTVIELTPVRLSLSYEGFPSPAIRVDLPRRVFHEPETLPRTLNRTTHLLPVVARHHIDARHRDCARQFVSD